MIWVEVAYLTPGGGKQSVRCTLASSTQTESALELAGCIIITTKEVIHS